MTGITGEVPLRDGHLDLLGGWVHRDGDRTRLTPTEIAALSVLADHAPEPVSEEELLRLAWGYRTTSTRTVSVTMSRIRQKIEVDSRSPSVLLTVRGKGYRLVPASDSTGAPSESTLGTPRSGVTPPMVARHVEHTAITDALSDGTRIVQLVGAGGIGKSTIARAAIADRRATWVPVDDADGAAGLIRRFADALGVEGDRAAVFAAVDRWEVLVLDGAESLGPDARAVLAELVQQTSTALLITTRQPLDLPVVTGAKSRAPSERRVLVGPLDRDAAIQVVEQQRRDGGLPDVPESQLAPLLDAFGGHPLALTLAAPVLDFEPDADTVLGLANGAEGADARSLQTVIERTLGGLPEASRDLLATLSTFAVPPRANLVADRTGTPLPTLLRELHELRTRGLVVLDHGRVAVHGFIRQVARTDAAISAHVQWVATYPQDPGLLRPIRHEVEQILPLAEGDTLAEALFRHLLVLHAFGPTERLLADITTGTTRLVGHRAVPVLEGAALVVANDGVAALERLDRGFAALDDDDLIWRARALLYLDFAAGQARDRERGRQIRRTIDALRPRIPDASLRHFMTIPAAIILSRELADAQDPRAIEHRIESMLREVEAEGNVQVALIAAIHRMLLLATSPLEVRALETRLIAVGKDALGPTGWARRWLDVAHLHLLVGQADAADALLGRHAPDAMAHDPGNAGTLATCIAHVLHRPELAARWLEWIPPDHPAWARSRWLLDRPEGDVPFDDPELVALLDAWRKGAPLPATRRWFHLRRALSNPG